MVRFRCKLRTVLLMALIMGLPWFQVAWADLDDGLVAYYPFNGDATDESGNGNDGTVNGAALTEDRHGNGNSAYFFDGYGNETDSINLPHTVLDGLTDFTTSLWVKAGNPNQKQATLLSAANQTQYNSYLVQIESDSEIEATIKNKLLTNFSNKKDYDLHDNKWHHVSITRQNDTGLAHIFVDGELVESGNFPKGALSIDEGGLMLGREQDCLAGCFDPVQDLSGSLDNLMIHNRALSEDEIKQLYEPDEPNPVTCSDDPATYSNETRQAILPCVEIPLYTDIAGRPIEFTGLYSAVLEIPFGFSDFEAKELNFLEIIEESNPSHARFNPDSGILDIPRIDVPTTVPLLDGETVPGPTLQCHAELQQSALRAEVLMLQEFDCNLP